MELPGISSFHTPGSIESFLGGSSRLSVMGVPGQITVSFWRIKLEQAVDCAFTDKACRDI